MKQLQDPSNEEFGYAELARKKQMLFRINSDKYSHHPLQKQNKTKQALLLFMSCSCFQQRFDFQFNLSACNTKKLNCWNLRTTSLGIWLPSITSHNAISNCYSIKKFI